MKKLKLVLLISVISVAVTAQSKMALGIFAGTSWYMGDVNPAQLLYAPMPTASGIFLFNFTKRWALRNQLCYIPLHSTTSTSAFYTASPSFSTSFIQADSRIEFNFSPFVMVDRKHAFSTYVNAGIGYTLPLSGSYINMVTFPFAVGIKYSLNKKIAIGTEWTENKTFTDKLDGLKFESPGGATLLHHNDWYTCFGFFVLYKIFDNPGNCPVYKN